MEVYVDGSRCSDGSTLRVAIKGYKDGKTILSYTSYVPIKGDNMTAEQVALLTAMEIIKDKYNDEEILLLSDQVFYVDILNSEDFKKKHFSRHEYLTYMIEAFHELKNTTLRYVRRNKNDADKLLREKENRLHDYHKINDCPINLYLVKVLSECKNYKFKQYMQ